MGHAYGEQLLPDRHALLFQMRAYAVARPRDPRVRARRVRAPARGPWRSWRASRRTDTWGFFGDGMLLNVVAMLEFDWATRTQ